jgi:hypothetical protein
MSFLTIISLMTMTDKVPETLVYSSFDQLMQLLAQEYFIEFSHRESFKLYIAITFMNCSLYYSCLTHWHTQPAVRRAEPSMPLLLILALCQ